MFCLSTHPLWDAVWVVLYLLALVHSAATYTFLFDGVIPRVGWQIYVTVLY
jgi:hypothetical protein